MRIRRRQFFAAMTGVFSLITGCRRATPIQDLGDPHQVVDDEYGLTRVHVAARSGNSALLDALLSNGGDPNVEDSSGATAKGRTPLHWALDAKCVDVLLSHGANIEYAGGAPEHSPISHLAYRNRHGSVARLIQKGAHVDNVDKMGMTPLIWCLTGLALGLPDDELHENKKLRLETVVLLIENGADVNHSGGSTALGAAIKFAPEYIPTLLKLGADPTIPDNGRTPLEWATEWEDPETIKLLKDAIQRQAIAE